MIKPKLKRIIIFTFLLLMALLFVAPVVIVIMNSFKSNQAISLNVFSLPNSISFVGWDNYLKGFTFGAYSFWLAFFYSLLITVTSVLLILIATSMAAWFIIRVNNKFTKIIYYLCIFSMVVPFQMVMFTLSKTDFTNR